MVGDRTGFGQSGTLGLFLSPRMRTDEQVGISFSWYDIRPPVSLVSGMEYLPTNTHKIFFCRSNFQYVCSCVGWVTKVDS